MQSTLSPNIAARRAPLASSDHPPSQSLGKSFRSTALRAGLACLLAAPALSASSVSYGFDSLTDGAVVGQDGWYADSTRPSTQIAAGTGTNTTKVMTSGPATEYVANAIRNFGTPFFSGTETKAVLQVDYRVGPAWAGSSVGMGGTSNANEVLNSSNAAPLSPKIGMVTNSAGTGISFSITPKSGAGWGTAVSQTVTFAPGTVRIGDWLQIRLTMNFTTGQGSLSYNNQTLGHLSYTGILTNVNLGLNGLSSSPNQWNQVVARIDRPQGGTPPFSAWDNLFIGTSGPGSENFQGPYATRTFNVWHYTTNPNGEQSQLSFPGFDAMLCNTSAQTHQFNMGYIPNINNTSDFARIETDPVNSSNKCLFLQNFLKPGATYARNELHYSTPYESDSQPNGTQYTFAFRFYTPTVLPGRVILMQGYSEFPWLRIRADGGQLVLDLAKILNTVSQYNAYLADPANNTLTEDFSDTWLDNYKIGSWNTVVVQVTHSNDPATGRIEVFVNGNKMTTYTGRTTFLTDSTKIPWLKAGPYGAVASVRYDDVYWRPGLILPYTESGFENNGIYELEPLCAPGKSLNVANAGTVDGTNVQIWQDSGAGNSRWTAQQQADGSFKLIPNHATTKRLDVQNAGGSGANVQIWQNATNPGQFHQSWRSVWQNSGALNGSFELIPQHNTGVRLDVAARGSANGTNVQVYSDNDTSAQRWRVIRKQ